jgi:hypothetical protein
MGGDPVFSLVWGLGVCLDVFSGSPLCVLFFPGTFGVVGCYVYTMLYSDTNGPAIFWPTADFDHSSCAECSDERVWTSYHDAWPSQQRSLGSGGH